VPKRNKVLTVIYAYMLICEELSLIHTSLDTYGLF